MKTRTTQTPGDRKQNWNGMNWIRQESGSAARVLSEM
jgi:hypothetical protein